MKTEIHALNKQIFQLNKEKDQEKEEFSIVNWYIYHMENGLISKSIWHELLKKRKDLKEAEEKLRNIEDVNNRKVATIREKLKKTKIQLIKQNKEVVKPMVE